MKSKALIGLICFCCLVGCRANHESLPDYVDEVSRAASKQIPSLQPEEEFEVFAYSRQKQRSPFELPVDAVVQSQPAVKKDCWQPVSRSAKAPLERFAISQLKFKGVISRDGKVSALIQIPNGKLAYIEKGQYMGVNHGRVSEINNQYLVISETRPDGLGCWNRHSVKLALK